MFTGYVMGGFNAIDRKYLHFKGPGQGPVNPGGQLPNGSESITGLLLQ